MAYAILIGLIVLLLAVILVIFSILNSITKQLKEHNSEGTDKPVNIQIVFRPLNLLCNEINRTIQISREREIETKKSSKSLKDSISNIIYNSVKFAVESVSVTLEEANGKCRLTVANPVDPMNDIDTEVIFERFNTGDKSRSNKSTGLGLYIAKTLADRNNIDIAATKKDYIFAITLVTAPSGDRHH